MFWRKSAKREDGPQAPQELYKNLKMKAADPNKAKWYAWGLVGAAVFLSSLTLRSNFDYLLQYYFGWSLHVRVAVFVGVEAFVVLAPLTKGYGNLKQIKWAFILEAVIIPLLFLHSYLVGQSIETRKEAEVTRTTAQTDLSRERKAADVAAEQNQRAQDSYNRAQVNHNAVLRRYERLKEQALRDGTPMPSMPIAPVQPQFVSVPKIDEGLVNNSTLDVSAVVQGKVDHNLLRALQFFILLCALAGVTLIVVVSDGMKVREWHLKYRQDDLNNTIQSQSPYSTIEQPNQSVIAIPEGGQATTRRQSPGFVAPITQATRPPAPSPSARPRFTGRLGKP